ncbi:AMP-binding enzyme [Methanimicrococcus blatticola]|uniref:AMP-binding enzyme n=1 Tax=Methanimicrococcus blatticola TaxID=91560 RepID=UPI0024425F19|nr:hypothetical protein [Methanimicrococcus blatticola]MCC2508527.1 hypothetical protein [Methanimicrococcus blatticola]
MGVPDIHKGEKPIGFVISDCATHKELKEYAKKHLAGYKVPREIWVVRNIPRINGWKLSRKSLKKLYETFWENNAIPIDEEIYDITIILNDPKKYQDYVIQEELKNELRRFKNY